MNSHEILRKSLIFLLLILRRFLENNFCQDKIPKSTLPVDLFIYYNFFRKSKNFQTLTPQRRYTSILFYRLHLILRSHSTPPKIIIAYLLIPHSFSLTEECKKRLLSTTNSHKQPVYVRNKLSD